jgi:tetratricopeptide (TPR) repeat protein
MPSRRFLEIMLNDGGTRCSKIDGLTDDVLHSILYRSARESFGDVLGEDPIKVMVSAMKCLEPALLPAGQCGGDALSWEIYQRLSPMFGRSTGFEEFDSRFAMFLGTLDSRITYARTPKLVELPRQKFGKPNLSGIGSLKASEDLAGYMVSLVKIFWQRGVLTGPEAEHLITLIEKISSAPGYLKYLDRERKNSEVVRLFNTVRRLQSSGIRDDPAMSDIIVSIGILLFNISPAEMIVDFLSSTKPSAVSNPLLYHYDAMMALNYLILGRHGQAGTYAASAYLFATDPEKKAYIRVLQSCISIKLGDYDRAIESLQDASMLEIPGRIDGLISFYTGVVFFERGEYANAIPCFEAAGRQVSDPLDRVTVHNSIGSCAMQIGDEARARHEFEAIEQISPGLKGTQASQCMLMVSSNMGAALGMGGDCGKAIDHYRKSLKVASGNGDLKTVTNLLGNLGVTLARSGDTSQALQALHACMGSAERTGYWAGIRFAFWHIYHTLLDVDNTEARQFHQVYTARYPELSDM